MSYLLQVSYPPQLIAGTGLLYRGLSVLSASPVPGAEVLRVCISPAHTALPSHRSEPQQFLHTRVAVSRLALRGHTRFAATTGLRLEDRLFRAPHSSHVATGG